ncbi:hypothetical protein FRC12_003475 [Ceratobasidium sp. 428]|nr:hypothetical protein FRC12_003475 [Ceratobasidium sp. 428]
MAESCAPQTPPFLQRHHRMDSFPTDDTSELSLSLDESDGSVFGVPESVSLGAFPMFLLQESPGSRKSVPQFPESPESSHGFPPAIARTTSHARLRILGNISTGSLGSDLERHQRHRPSDSWDSQLSTPTRGPCYETQSQLLSAKPSLMDFGARSEEDETLVGHYDGASANAMMMHKKLRPVMSFSSTTSTSTALASPLSDTFSPGPGSTSCSVSTSTSYSSHRSPCVDEFPTEVGGMASLDLEEPDRKLFTVGESTVDLPSLAVESSAPLEPAPKPESNSPLRVPDIHTPPRPSLKHPSAQHHTPKSSISSVVSSPIVANHRRAFSGARELVVENLSASGRLRSCSVNSTSAKRNELIEQAARSRSRSNSVSASASLAGSGSTSTSATGATRTLNSMQSKESFRTKFANIPGYVTFLREITVEVWIDQEGFRAIRPQFELHRYTPGHIAPVTPNLRLGASPKSPKSSRTRPRSAQHPVPLSMTSPRKAGEELRRPSTSDSIQRSGLHPASAQTQTSPLASAPELKPVEILESWGMAEFTMTKRQGWNFHHGVVEGEPKLRRLTINGVEDVDYLSRQASLSVRSNGVYTVNGSEDHGRFPWKFEYLVEDRRGPTGAIIQGEKTLTPLTFSCAPEMLIPEQGKKVGLLRVMKKSVIPKISASKMDPVLVPTAPVTPSRSTSSTEEHAKGKTFETLAKIVRPSSHSKSRSPIPRHASGPLRRVPQRTAVDAEDGHRRAASYSNMRPDLKQILGEGYSG